MDGPKIAEAKAIALALYWIARQQKRWTCLVGFSGGTEGNFCVMPPEEERQEELIEWLEHFYGNGTDMDVPLAVLPRRWEAIGAPRGKTDILMITDAICHVPEAMERDFNQWRKHENAKVTTIIIEADPGDLVRVSDRIHLVADLHVENDAVADVMTI